MNIKPKQRSFPGDAAAFAAYDYRWTFRRMSCQQPGVSPSAGPPVVDAEIAAVTKKVRSVPRPVSWNFAAPPDINRDPRHPGFTRVKRGSAIASTEAKIDELLDACFSYFELVSARPDPDDISRDRFLNTEVDAAKKVTVQKGMVIDAPFTRVGPDDPISEDNMPRWYEARLRQVMQVYARARLTNLNMPFAPAPFDTNAGYPTMAPGGMLSLPGKLVSALLVVDGDLERTKRILDYFSDAVGIDRAAAACYGFGGRQGPLYKAQPLRVYNRSRAEWLDIGEWAGCKSRWRTVQMAMYALLLAIDRLFRWLKAAQAAVPGLWHKGDVSVTLPPFAHVYPMDLSGYDTTVSLSHKTIASRVMLEFMPELRADLDMWLYSETRSVALPDVQLEWDRMSILQEASGIKSGNKVTSVMGTVYNVAHALEALGRIGFRVSDWPHTSDFRLLVYGDDVLLATDRDLSRPEQESIASTYAETGLVISFSGGDDFLARHITPGKPGRPNGGRLLQQRLFNEHEDTGPIAAERAMIGLLASTPGVDSFPPYLASALWDVLRRAEWIEARRDVHSAATLPAALRAITSNYGDDIVAALKIMQRDGEFASLAAEAEHSASAAATIDLARRVLGDVDVTSSPQSHLLDKLARAVISSDLSDVARVRLATSGFYAVNRGAHESLAIWQQDLASLLTDTYR